MLSDDGHNNESSCTLIPVGTATYLLIWPDDGVMKKEDIRGIYDGSIFYKKAEEYKRKQRAKADLRSSTSRSLVERAKKLM